jgi:hypothetical protein
MSLIEQMELADQFELYIDHPWRPTHYFFVESVSDNADDFGLVMVEQLAGKYQVCRVERFVYAPDDSTSYQPKYYGEFSHNQLAQAFKRAATIAAQPLTDNHFGA